MSDLSYIFKNFRREKSWRDYFSIRFSLKSYCWCDAWDLGDSTYSKLFNNHLRNSGFDCRRHPECKVKKWNKKISLFYHLIFMVKAVEFLLVHLYLLAV